MGASPDILTRPARTSELAAVLAVQHEAFSDVAAQFGIDPSALPPLRETVGDLQRMVASGTVILAAVRDDVIVGTVRGTVRDDGVVEIGRLAVARSARRAGIARALVVALEQRYPPPRCFELFTGERAHAPLALYRSLGYEEFPAPDRDAHGLVWLRHERR